MEDEGAVRVADIPLRPLRVGGGRRLAQGIARGQRPVLGPPATGTPPAAGKAESKRGVEGRPVDTGLAAGDPTAHAEIVALRQAARAASNYRLAGATLYVTLEPCLMCVGAIVNARVASVVYGAPEPKWGALGSILDARTLKLNHRLQVIGGVLEAACRQIVVDFFKFRRDEDLK
jgi:tRNA(adenine34) deaminase